VDPGEPVPGGHVILTITSGAGGTPEDVGIDVDPQGFFSGQLSEGWRSVEAYHVPLDGYGDSTSEQPIVREGVPVGILFHDDFEDGVADGWDLEPGWQVIQEDDGNHVLSGEGHTWATLERGQDWEDYTFRSRLKLLAGGIHLNFRLTDTPGGLSRYFLSFREGALRLHKEGFARELAISETHHSLGSWHDVEIVADGPHLQVYVNGILEIDYVDDDLIPRGSIAFETLDGSRALIDDVEVTEVR
jgi:hypothetical protein